eukprot:9950249-Ditylum_brightwellii.AAC.1
MHEVALQTSLHIRLPPCCHPHTTFSVCHQGTREGTHSMQTEKPKTTPYTDTTRQPQPGKQLGLGHRVDLLHSDRPVQQSKPFTFDPCTLHRPDIDDLKNNPFAQLATEYSEELTADDSPLTAAQGST